MTLIGRAEERIFTEGSEENKGRSWDLQTLRDLRFLLLKFPLSPAALLADPTAFFTEGNEKNKGRSWICKPFVIFVSFC